MYFLYIFGINLDFFEILKKNFFGILKFLKKLIIFEKKLCLGNP